MNRGDDFILPPAMRTVSTPPAAPLGDAPELFFCEPYKARLTKPACAARWTKVNAPGVRVVRGQGAIEHAAAAAQFSRCVHCPVGARHLQQAPPSPNAKERQRAERMAEVVVRRAAIAAEMDAAPTSAPKEARMPRKPDTLITHDGQTLSAHAWAKLKNIDQQTLRGRWKRGVRGEALFAKPGASARKGGASAKTEKPAPATPAAPAARKRPPVADARAAARETAAHVGAAGVLRALGFSVDELVVPAGVALLVREPGA